MNQQSLKEQLKKASISYLRGEVKKIMDSKNFGEQWQVGTDEENYIVSWITEKGYSYMQCTCKNGSMHPLRNPECWHKTCVRLFEQSKLWEK